MNIALLTDFGTRDYFVAAMKGVIHSINKNVTIIDITHDIEPHNINAASFTLRACYKDFPEKTIFTAVVDPGVGSARRAILVETEIYYFIAPDNGLLSFVFADSNTFRTFELTDEKFFHHPVSNTFHGRDIFAPAAAHLSTGILPSEFGREINDFLFFQESKPKKLDAQTIVAEIIHCDHFGNLITNLMKDDLPQTFSIEINRHLINVLNNYYSAAHLNEMFMIIGSAGYLEIVANQNSAQKLLNAKIGDKVIVRSKD